MITLEVLHAAGADLGEGPAWDADRACLWWVDVTGGRVHRFDPATGDRQERRIGPSPSAVLPSNGDPLVVCLEDGVHTLDWADGAHPLVVPMAPDDPSIRLNDAAADPAGRLWAGTMAYDFRPGAAMLCQVRDGVAEPVLTSCTISNGLGWSPDGTRMYYVDTPTQRVDILDYDLATGIARDRRPLAVVDPDHGSPDGLTVDVDGGVWVALWGGGRLHRYDDQGRLTEVVRFPVTQVTSACFGGPGLATLFVTSAAHRLTDAQRAEQPLAGALFAVDTGTTGVACARIDLATLAAR